MAKNGFAQFRAGLTALVNKVGTPDDKNKVRKILHQTAQFLTDQHAISGNLSVGALENLHEDSLPVLNRDIDILDDIGPSKVIDYVTKCGVPADLIPHTALEVMRILDNGIERSNVLETVTPSREHMSIESFAGRGGAAMLRHDAKVATEAFGTDIDRMQSDNRLNIVLTVLRAFTSITDKLFPRLAEEGNVVTIKVPAPEVYDLAVSMNSNAAVRNNPAARQALVTLYKNPDPVNTQLKPIQPLTTNDTGTVKALYNNTTSYATGNSVNVFDLALDPNRFGFNAIDYTDLVSPGGHVSYLYVLATHTTSGGTVTSELYKVPVKFLSQSVYVNNPNNMDSGDVIVVMQTQTMIRKGALNAAGNVNTMFAAYTDAVVQLNLNFASELSLKTGQLSGQGSANGVLKPLAGGGAISGATSTDFALLTFSIVAFDADLFYDEENMRKTTTAVRLNQFERQFVIPMGRNTVVDYALNQQSSEEVAQIVNNTNALGNSARGLSIMSSVLSDMYDAIQFEKANPELAGLVNVRTNSLAGTVCIPYVVKSTLDYSDATIEVLRESERLVELHGRFRARVLTALTTLCSKTLYLNNLNPGEKVVFKVLAAQPIADQIIGIIDYHDKLEDNVPPANGADWSMELPNGHRIDIVKTYFETYDNTVTIIPVRDADPDHITSFGTTRDRGTYVAQYTPINNGGVARRVVSNTREILFPTNIIGVQITVSNLDPQLGPQV